MQFRRRYLFSGIAVVLATDPALRSADPVRIRAAMLRKFEYVKQFSVNDISLSDSAGVVRHTLNSPELIGRDFSFRKYFQRLREPDAAGPIHEHITFQGLHRGERAFSSRGRCAATPANSSAPSFSFSRSAT